MSEGNSDLCVVVYGTPWDGMAIHGPFTHDAAVESTSEAIDNGEPWEIVTLHEPDDRFGMVDRLMGYLAEVNADRRFASSERSSNDSHIAALIDALDEALSLLGIERESRAE